MKGGMIISLQHASKRKVSKHQQSRIRCIPANKQFTLTLGEADFQKNPSQGLCSTFSKQDFDYVVGASTIRLPRQMQILTRGNFP